MIRRYAVEDAIRLTNKYITFDCYGTLLDASGVGKWLAKIATQNNLSAEKAIAIYTNYEDRLMYGEEFHPYQELLQLILDYCDQELVTDVFHDQLGALIKVHKNFRPFPDVIPALTKLKQHGWQLILMSNTNHDIMESNRQQFNSLIDDVVLADDVHCYKPDLRFFKAAAAKYQFANDKHIHIANGYWWDIVPCAKLDWPKIWCNRSEMKGNQREQPYQEIHSLNEIDQAVLQKALALE